MCSSNNGTVILTGQGGFISEESKPEFADSLQHRAGSGFAIPLHCKWLIQGMSGETIRIHFISLKTEELVDFVTVYDGPTAKAAPLLHESGRLTPADLFSTSNSLLITFSADYALSGSGFSLSWCIVGTSCPELEGVVLPSPIPLPSLAPMPVYNETAPALSPVPSPQQPLVAPEYPPRPDTKPVEGTCCTANCNSHGLCNPVSCRCACYTGFSGESCSDFSSTAAAAAKMQAANMLLQLDTGVDSPNDTVVESGQQVRQLNLDPIKGLIEKLRMELFRSLSYEHSASNATKQQCEEELVQQDEDLRLLAQDVTLLNNRIIELDLIIKNLTEKRDSLGVQIRYLEASVAEITQRIHARTNLKETREKQVQQQLKTFQSIRDILYHIGGYTCEKAPEVTYALRETKGVECTGDLLDTVVETNTASDCNSSCGIDCSGFSFRSDQGCRFFSALRNETISCLGPRSTITCSCFQKVRV
jgi:hypothetical protein